MKENNDKRTMCDICGKRLWQHIFFVYGLETTACPACYNKWIAGKPPGSTLPRVKETCRHCGDPECDCDHEWSDFGLDEPIECLKCGDPKMDGYSKPPKAELAGQEQPADPTNDKTVGESHGA